MNRIMRNKKGAEMTIGTLVVIVLAIIVLVVLALGFGTGWTNLWSKISGIFTPVNVDSTKQACQYACTTQATYAYCCQQRDVISLAADGKTKDTTTYKGKTCEDLQASSLGFEACDSVACPGVCEPAGTCGGTVMLCTNPKMLDNTGALCKAQAGCSYVAEVKAAAKTQTTPEVKAVAASCALTAKECSTFIGKAACEKQVATETGGHCVWTPTPTS